MQRKDWAARVDGLVVFRGLLSAAPFAALRAALAADAADLTGAVAAFESTLFLQGTNWTEVLLDAVLEDENLCLRTACLRTNTYILKYNPAVSSVYLYYNGNINELSSIISYFCNI